MSYVKNIYINIDFLKEKKRKEKKHEKKYYTLLLTKNSIESRKIGEQ